MRFVAEYGVVTFSTSTLVRLMSTAVVVGLASGLLGGASAQAGPNDPYVSDTVPVAKGCIVLGREWAGVKVYLVQKRLGTTWEKDRYLQGTYEAVKKFQRKRDLRVTGRVNRRTWNALGMERPFCMDRFTVQPQVGEDPSPNQRIATMVDWARGQIGRRYVWGGAGAIGYDCSGLALQALHAAGRVLPTVTTYLHQRQDFGTATAIYESGLRRYPLSERQRGDLVFYGPSGSMTHMAIYIGKGKVIEAVRPRVQKARMRGHGVALKPFVVRPFGR